MTFKPTFPTILHQDAGELIRDYFLNISSVDTVLVVNSCARGQAVPESDLDFAILVKPGTKANEIKNIESTWKVYLDAEPAFLKFKQSSPFAHLHLDIIEANYIPTPIEVGEPIDYFEIEIGNQICYSAPMDHAGSYFLELQKKWLPYYNNELRLLRLTMARKACAYDLDHIPFFINRGLYFQAFDKLYKAFQAYLQTLFIANKIYPIAYNKWIKEQVVKWLQMPGLYPKLSPILSIGNIESDEINGKVRMLRELLNDLPNN
ncbi:MAG: nucleotidyltransferase domain-containing protein [Ferruginibacter sp.]